MEPFSSSSGLESWDDEAAEAAEGYVLMKLCIVNTPTTPNTNDDSALGAAQFAGHTCSALLVIVGSVLSCCTWKQLDSWHLHFSVLQT
jgi:hypothetical protein